MFSLFAATGSPQPLFGQEALRFSIRHLAFLIAAVAVLTVIAIPFMQARNAPPLTQRVNAGYPVPARYPNVHSVTLGSYHPTRFSNLRARIVLLHKKTKPPVGRAWPEPLWFECQRPSMTENYRCTVNGKRVYPTDDVKVYYATDEESPSLVKIPFKEFEKYERSFPHEIWVALVPQK